LSFSNSTNGDSGVFDPQVAAMSETNQTVRCWWPAVSVCCSPGKTVATRPVRSGWDCAV